MNIIAALSILGVATAAANASVASADRHALRHIRSLQDKCAADVMECDDGSFVGRDPNNGCDFSPCPEEVAPTTCLVNNLEVEVGQEYTAPDGCNVGPIWRYVMLHYTSHTYFLFVRRNVLGIIGTIVSFVRPSHSYITLYM